MESYDMTTTQPARWIRIGFAFTLFLSALSGFAQMPIFKRYYIADIPGFGWLAKFYVTYTVHYISAIALITLLSYLVTDYLIERRTTWRMTLYGYIRTAMLSLILMTGIMLVFRNLPGYRYSPQFVVALDFSHLGLVVLFLAFGLVGWIAGKRWLRKAQLD